LSETSETELRATLIAARNVVYRRELIWACITVLGLTSSLLLLIDALGRAVPLREKACFICILCVVLGALVWFVLQTLRLLLRAPGPEAVALAIEHVNPEFLDALVCAAELEHVKPERRGLIGEALLADVRGRTQDFDFLGPILPRRLHSVRLVALALLFAAIAACSLRSGLVSRAGCHLRDLAGGRHTGLSISPGDDDVPEHADVRITAGVLRWENAADILYEEAGKRHRFVMNRSDGRQHTFTLYDVSDSVRYRIVTPSLVSRWYTIRTYRPPALRHVEMSVTPPAYTGKEPVVYHDLRDCSTVEGSRLRLTVQTDAGVRVIQETDAGETPFVVAGEGQSELGLLLDRGMSFRLRLQDASGRTTVTPEVTIRLEPDLPPVVDVLQPNRDVKTLPTGTVALEARASDDFGLGTVSLQYSVSGGAQQSLVLHEGSDVERMLDGTVHHSFDAKAMGLREGDVVSYFVSAKDNREPEAQRARSEVYFIEVRPEIKPEDDAASGQQQQMDISGLIAELKRLIRLTWDVLSSEPERRGRLEEELRRGVRDLHLEAERKVNEMREATGGREDALLGLLQAAAGDIERAENLLERRLVEESLSPQGQALAKLVTLETELMKNAARGKQGEEESESGESEDQQEKQQEAKSPSQGETLAALKRLLEQLRQLSGRQSRLNDNTARARERGDAEELGSAFAGRQRGIREDGEPLRAELSRLPDAGEAARGTDAALREMGAAETKLEHGEIRPGTQHGKRAHNYLLAATRSLEEAYRRASADEIQRLTAAAQGLAQAQRKETESSRALEQEKTVDRETVKASREKQQQLQTAAEQLQTDIDRTAAELEETYPEAARALAESARNSRQNNLDGDMTRAANALLYRRFDRARKHQVDAANTLQQLASQLGAAGRLLPAMSREELMEALSQLRENAKRVRDIARKPDATDAQQLDRVQERASRQVDTLAMSLQDETLQRVGDELAMPMGSDDAGESSHRLLGLLEAAAAVIEKHLLAGELVRRFTLSRQTSVPPEKYRRLVERYFKDLSRTK